MIENCDKRRYPDAIAAKYTLEKIRRINDPEHKETRAYYCPRCRGWHLTSQPKGKP